MHRLLERQLKRYLGEAPAVSAEWAKFLEAVGEAYGSLDAQREMLERSLVLSSQELHEANAEMRAIFQAIPDLLFRLAGDGTIVDLKAGTPGDLMKPIRKLVGKKIQKVPDREIGRKFGEAIARVVGMKETAQFEYSLKLKEAEAFYEARFVPLLDDQLIVIVQNITHRKNAEAKLEEAHKRLLEMSRMSGMAEVATGVLHNVGNVLTSINVSANLVQDRVRQSRVGNLNKAMELIEGNKENLATFLSEDQRGKALPGYLSLLAKSFGEDQEAILLEMKNLAQGIDHIKQVVQFQQNFAGPSTFREKIDPATLMDGAMRINLSSLERHQVKVVRDFEEIGTVSIDQHKTLQILVNLISNAKNALKAGPAGQDRMLTLRLRKIDEGKAVRFEVCDNGVGITAENRTRIFTHGFTTHSKGHGFGLHSAANAAREMNGSLTAFSDGAGKGATFTLEIPIAVQQAKAA